MVLGGVDTRYDLPWSEQEKIRRRQALRQRLKQDGIRQRYDPFKHMSGQIFFDPALDRYMDVRKRGRLPNTPMRPTLFYGYTALIFVPVIIFTLLTDWERKPYEDGCKDGSIPYRERTGKCIG